jgi:hypothetical protein
MKCLAFGGIRLKNYHGRWLGSLQPMDVSLGRYNMQKTSFRIIPNPDKMGPYPSLVIVWDSSIILSTVPTTPLLCMRTEVGHFFPGR